jgi:FlaA1/EpsC-like NDP-sugar epimerase
MTPTVAVAGATGSVGKTLVEQILKEEKFSVIALTRSVCPHNSLPLGLLSSHLRADH